MLIAIVASIDIWYDRGMARRSDARASAIATTERLVRLQGAAATGIAQIIAESGAPKGSFYFHFPGGKEQLLLEMLDGYASAVTTAIEQVDRAVPGNAVTFADALCAAIAADMERDGFTRGCALQALTDEYVNTDTGIARAVRQHNDRWVAAIARALRSRGIGQIDAERLALWLTTMTHGARVQARLSRSAAPFDVIRSTMPFVFAIAASDASGHPG